MTLSKDERAANVRYLRRVAGAYRRRRAIEVAISGLPPQFIGPKSDGNLAAYFDCLRSCADRLRSVRQP